MNNPSNLFKECQRILEERRSCRFGDRRFLVELGKAWAAQLEIFLTSQGIVLRSLALNAVIPEGDKRSEEEVLTAAGSNAPFPPIPGHLVAAMLAVQKLFRGTLDPDNKDHTVDAINYAWIAFDERTSSAK